MKNELEPNIEKQLIELKQEILKIEDIEYDKYIEKLKQIIEEINQKEEKLNKLIENRNTLQEYKNQLRHIEKRSDAYNTNEYTNILKARYKYMSSSKLKNKLNKLARILLELDEKEENTLWNFIISIVILRKKPEFLKENGVLMHLMLEEYYIKSLIAENEKELKSEDFEGLKKKIHKLYTEEYIPISKKILKQIIKKQIDINEIDGILEQIQTLKDIKADEKNPTPILSSIKEILIDLYPIVLTTVDSVISNYWSYFKNGDKIDYIIIDESSQCDILSALPLLYIAKSIIIVGDEKQLSAITDLDKSKVEINVKKEYDYTDEYGLEHTSTYNGKAGLQLGFIDKLVLGIKTGDLKLAFSSEITKDSKILMNRNIIKRAKQVMPYLIYDEKPYTVVTEDGKIVWVLDAYTVSSEYPYSQYTTIEHDGTKEKINYIRNSVKVIIDSYDGTMKFYVTDKTDPIIMAYRNTYPTIFEDINSEIPQDISEHFIYPEYLYNVQAELLKVYHNVKADVLYRTDDLWNFAKYNSTIVTKSSGNIMKPYYTMINKKGSNEVGLIQIYTPDSKQNLISYLVGTTEGSANKLKLYKFSQDSNIFGPMQLDNQIEQDETIYSEIQSLNTSGTKVTKDMVVVPVNNTLLYVESIYQTMLNVESKIPVLKKVVVASGNKVAIGDSLSEALNNLLSKEASNIEVENTDDVDGLIDAIVKANKNLSESTNNKDWELMGSDIKKLQSLIHSLEIEKAKEDKKKAETKNDVNEVNNVIENIVE